MLKLAQPATILTALIALVGGTGLFLNVLPVGPIRNAGGGELEPLSNGIEGMVDKVCG